MVGILNICTKFHVNWTKPYIDYWSPQIMISELILQRAECLVFHPDVNITHASLEHALIVGTNNAH